jgi:hypothetical protein
MARIFQTGRHFDYGPTKSNSFEGRMAKQYLRNIIRCATALEAALDDNDDLPGWVNAKIVTADDRLTVATQYMMYEINRHSKDGAAKYNAESWSGRAATGPAAAATAAAPAATAEAKFVPSVGPAKGKK